MVNATRNGGIAGLWCYAEAAASRTGGAATDAPSRAGDLRPQTLAGHPAAPASLVSPAAVGNTLTAAGCAFFPWQYPFGYYRKAIRYVTNASADNDNAGPSARCQVAAQQPPRNTDADRNGEAGSFDRLVAQSGRRY